MHIQSYIIIHWKVSLNVKVISNTWICLSILAAVHRIVNGVERKFIKTYST